MPVGQKILLPVKKTPLSYVVSVFQDHLFMPDPLPLYSVLGMIAANLIEGDPIWLMLVGSSSSGKTELIWSTRKLPYVFPRDDLSKPGILSMAKPKERSRHSKGGLLMSIGMDKLGILLLEDFTVGVLSKRPQEMDELLGILRSLSKGSHSREGGTDHIEWSGKFAMLTACTPNIDSYHVPLALMGNRFVFVRMPKTDGEKEAEKVLSRTHSRVKPSADAESPEDAEPEVLEMREHLADTVRDFFNDHVDPGHVQAQVRGSGNEDGLSILKRMQISAKSTKHIIDIAALAVKCRSPVERNQYNREVENPPYEEGVPRMAGWLGQLYLGLKAIHLEDQEERWRVLTRVAIDSMPLIRRRALVAMSESEQPLALDQLCRLTGVGVKSMERTMWELQHFGIVQGKAFSVMPAMSAAQMPPPPFNGVNGSTHHLNASAAVNSVTPIRKVIPIHKNGYSLSNWGREKWSAAFPDGVRSVLQEEL
jgi:hypothetical protein